MMPTFENIDPVLGKWADLHQIKIMKEDGENFRRYFYTSSKLGETFQIVIEPEQNGAVRLDGHLIESSNNEEAHFMWELPLLQLTNGLDLSLASAQAWFRRLDA